MTDHRPSLGHYDRAFTPFFAARADPRFCYCLFVPRNYDPDGFERYELMVLVHGTERGAWKYRERFAAFAERHSCIILAPLFPANTFGSHDLDNYKYIECNGVRYDHILLGMVDEVRERYRLRDQRFLMFGFSGGGHFSHRFFYLHPEHLKAVSIGAPGIVTQLDDQHDFWVGVRDLETRFGHAVDYDTLRHVPVQMVIGANDNETWEISFDESDRLWMPGAQMTASLNRLQRMELLKRSFRAHGIRVRHTIVPGIGHETLGVIPAVKRFFASVLREQARHSATQTPQP